MKKTIAEIPIPVPFDENFGLNEPLIKRTRRTDEVTSAVEPVDVDVLLLQLLLNLLIRVI